MRLFRIAHQKYAADLTGTGGLFGPGRWHRQGTRIVYFAEHVSLAKLEVLANSPVLPANQVLITVELPANAAIFHLDANTLPEDWDQLPYREELANITDRWIQEGRYWVMRVPSVHAPYEYNYLINPLHPEHNQLKVLSTEPHIFDKRLK